MDSVFFQSVLIRPTRIMGVQLRPFSAYHALVLLHFDSPFLTGREATQTDIVVALCILSQGIEDKLSRFIKFDTSKLYRFYWLMKMLFASKSKMQDVRDALISHMVCYFEQPEIWSKKGSDNRSHVPWPFLIVATVLQRFHGLTENEVWDMGISRAACYRACFAESVGDKLVDEQGVEGQHKRWVNSPVADTCKTLTEFLEWEKKQDGS